MDDLAIALTLEQEIVLANGIESKCGCTKFAMCPFPNTSWYYATICVHDNDSAPIEGSYWWFDTNNLRMVSTSDFMRAFRDAQLEPALQDEAPKNLVSRVIAVRIGPRLLYVAGGGQVRQLYPKQIPRGGGWL